MAIPLLWMFNKLSLISSVITSCVMILCNFGSVSDVILNGLSYFCTNAKMSEMFVSLALVSDFVNSWLTDS